METIDYPMDTREHARRSLTVLDLRARNGSADGETAVTVRERIFARWPDLRSSDMDANLEAARERVRGGKVHIHVRGSLTDADSLGFRIVEKLDVERVERHEGPCAESCSHKEAERARYRRVHEAGMRDYRKTEERAMRKAVGLERLLPRDILHAITFGSDAPAQRVALGSETLNTVAELMGLRNGMISTLELPRKAATLIQRLDAALLGVEVTLMPHLEHGRAWANRQSVKGTRCHD